MKDPQNLRGLPDTGQFLMTWKLGALSLDWVPCSQEWVLFTSNSSCAETGKWVTKARCLLWWSVRHPGTLDIVRRQGFRVGQIGLQSWFALWCMCPVRLPGLSEPDPGDMWPSNFGYAYQVLWLASPLLSGRIGRASTLPLVASFP